MLNGILIHTHMRSNIRLKMMYLQCMTIFKKQSIIKKTKQVNWIQYWEKSCRYTLKFVENSNDVRIYDEEQFIMYAHFFR